jgi:hypothetical protein
MYKNRNIILLSFATLDLNRSIERFKKQAILSNYYDRINVITPPNLSDENKKKINYYLKLGKKRGYAYWYWKPLILLDMLNKVNNGDIVHYLDIGFHINKTLSNKFNNYLEILDKDNRSLLAFQYFQPKNINSSGVEFPERDEFKYTKSDLLDYFGKISDKSITHTAQFSAGNIFFKKNEETIKFLNNWIDVFEKRFDLIDDTPSKIENFNMFVENRHDQSVFSILCKINLFESLSAYEFDWGEKNQKRTWDHIIDYPFLAKRDLEYDIFKRFMNRQIRTYRRFKKKLFKR